MRIYNTMTRQKEEFVPLKEGEVRIYGCGPTVYNRFHVGNALAFCIVDVLHRFLEYRGYKVRCVQNFTDIDDKIIRLAGEEGVDYSVISERYIDEYWIDAKGLNLLPADAHPRATEYIGEIIAMVKTLIDKGHAYEAQGDVYFSAASFAEYGKLSRQPLEDLAAGARIMVGEIKRAPVDFALWKTAKPGEPAWDSPWGRGRPGWHIECSAMAKALLGDTIDIHCGGQDLIFPHHENEVAQSECCNGVLFARYWMHNGYINVDNVKMSKSLGNFFTVRDVAEKYGYEALRFQLIASHYRSPVNYSTETVEQSRASLQRIHTCRNNLDFALQSAPEAPEDAKLLEALARRRGQFIAAMEDDLNTADALAAIFELVRDINVGVLEAGASKATCLGAAALLDELCGVLGLLYERKKDEGPDDTVAALVIARAEARKAKDWARADEIRDELKALGYAVEDTPQGAKVVRI